ncbi:hypothetical protein H4582DRAFT_2125876 [Lactarius indigo]|nr:hypothetical protein H4582DRAFT_2125876 [Lactarius indigo]
MASNHIRHSEERPWPVHHDDVHILDGCTFPLERLACFFSWTELLEQWLATQPQLTPFEHDAHSQGECLTLMQQTRTEEYLLTWRILRTFADKAPNLTCLTLYENIDYLQLAGENKRILRVIKEHFAKLQVFVWVPLSYPVPQNENDFKDEYSFDKTERYALAMFDAVPAMRSSISFCKGPCCVWRRGPPLSDLAVPRPFKRAPLSIRLAEDTFRAVDPDQPIELFVTDVPHGPPLAEPFSL